MPPWGGEHIHFIWEGGENKGGWFMQVVAMLAGRQRLWLLHHPGGWRGGGEAACTAFVVLGRGSKWYPRQKMGKKIFKEV